MASNPNFRGLQKRGLALHLLALVLVGLLVEIGLLILLPQEKLFILTPMLATIVVYVAFLMMLHDRVRNNLFGELGFLYISISVVYTILPALTFVIVDLDLASGWVWKNLSQLLPAPRELGLHLWRHVLFIAGVAIGYLALRGRQIPEVLALEDTKGKDDSTILFLLGIVLFSILCISLMSAPVHTYIDNYTRFDHLSWFPRKFVSLCARMKQGLYIALITFLFMHHRKYKLLIPPVIFGMAVYEIAFSFGSRIESLVILLMAVCLHHHFIKPVSLKQGLAVCLAIAVVFSGLEILRSYDFDISQTRSVVSDRGVGPASEFGAVYLTGFHMYAERAQGAIPPKEWPMFFNDFISLVTPNDFTRWHPQYWYARAYFPNDIVPPETLGPITDSAIWGGEIDLIIRSLINGAFFAYIIRWFIKHKNKWWGTAVYVFCFATCIMTLKYSVFWHLNPLFKTFLPTVLFIEAVRRFLPSKRHRFARPNQAQV